MARTESAVTGRRYLPAKYLMSAAGTVQRFWYGWKM
jgi:hypothetical protein